MSKETVRVPDIGGVDAAEVVELLVSVGDQVDLEQGLLVLESDKASMEIPSTVAGTVVEILAAEGSQLAEGDAVMVIEAAGDAAVPEPAQDAVEEAAPAESGEQNTPEAPPAESAGSVATPPTLITVAVPDIGTEDAVDVVEVAVAEGDVIEEGDSLIVLESDKASMEVPSTVSGVVRRVIAAEGQQLREGDAVVEVEVSGTDAAEAPAPEAPPESPPAAAPVEPAQKATPAAAPAAAGESSAHAYAGPAVRKLAREFGVPLAEVSGSGPRNRILKEDLHRYVQGALENKGAGGGAAIPEVPEVDFARFGEVEVVERTKIDRLTAENMHRSWLNVPRVTQFDEVDITELEAFRKSLKAEGEARGTKMTLVPILLKACATALRRHEKINASLSGGGTSLTLKRYVHIGMAVDTPAGLVVPVLRDVDRKSLWELAEEVMDLAGRARDRKLRPEEMQGASFTVSSLGAIGGRGFTPIINTPEVAILGVSRAQTQPVWDGTAFAPRLMLPLTLAYDHRVVNGGDGGRFLTDLKALLEDLRRQLL